jgi:ABC-type tungstate transport system substrate-binding protein
MTPPTRRTDSPRFLDWLAAAHFLNAVLTGLVAVAIALHPVFHRSERLATLGAFLALYCVLLASLDWWAGLCLRNRRGRGFCLVVSALICLSLPGVLVGVATLALLTRPGAAGAFVPEEEA